LRRLRSLTDEPDINMLATGALARDVHSAGLYLVVAVASGFAAAAHPDHEAAWWALCLIAVPVVASLALARYAKRDALLSDKRVSIEHRAVELLQQADAAPNRWAERLAPNTLPPTPGYSVGHVRQAGTGVMSGDLLDVYHLPSGRLCCVVGDVSGHDVEASITALQTKFLLRSYLRRYRDPGQALEELNRQLVDYERPEEFVSLFVVVFDTEAGTLRYASAGHPSVWLCQDHHVRPLRSTGPLLMLDGEATYLSREESVSAGDVVVMFTDGLVLARAPKGNLHKEAEKLARQNKLFVRERIDLLCDPGTFVEDGLLANAMATDLPADGVVTGVGEIDGRPVAVMANDPTVKAGSWGARTVEKIVRLTDLALRDELPVFWLVDSAGARITDQVELFPGRRGAGRIFYNQVRLSGKVPQICCLFGPSAAGGAYIPAFCDIVIMVEGNASMYLGSPRMAEMVIGEVATLEETGGARMHCTVSGCGDNLAVDDADAIEQAKAYFTYFPPSTGVTPRRSTRRSRPCGP
jgi:hypothetical protein